MTSVFRRGAVRKKGNWGDKKSSRRYTFDKYNLPKAPDKGSFILVRHDFVDPNPTEGTSILGPDGQPLPVVNPFFKVRVHKAKLSDREFREDSCSSGRDPYNQQPCSGCSAMDRGDKRITVADNIVYPIIHLSRYHQHPWIDKEGKEGVKKDGTPIIVDYECWGRSCNYCRVRRGEAPVIKTGGKPWVVDINKVVDVYGKQKYIQLGSGQAGNLAGWDQQVSGTCKGCNGTAYVTGFFCPQCNTCLVDASSFPGSDAEMYKVGSEEHVCNGCRRTVLPVEGSACDGQETGQCKEAQPVTLFDRVLTGQKQGEDKNTVIVLVECKTIEQFEQSLSPADRAALRGSSLHARISELYKPLDLEKIFSPRPLEDQAENLNVQVPGQAQQGPQTTYYGK